METWKTIKLMVEKPERKFYDRNEPEAGNIYCDGVAIRWEDTAEPLKMIYVFTRDWEEVVEDELKGCPFCGRDKNSIETINRAGAFEVSDSLIEKEPELVMKVFGEVIVTRAEHLYYKGAIEYYALSKHFREVKEGEKIPRYTIEYNKDGVKFIEIE